MDDLGVGVQFSVEARDFSLSHNVQTGSEVHSASCTTGSGGCFPWGKATGA
jgi:hypothetical protein